MLRKGRSHWGQKLFSGQNTQALLPLTAMPSHNIPMNSSFIVQDLLQPFSFQLTSKADSSPWKSGRGDAYCLPDSFSFPVTSKADSSSQDKLGRVVFGSRPVLVPIHKQSRFQCPGKVGDGGVWQFSIFQTPVCSHSQAKQILVPWKNGGCRI